jgi:hypothetical protein
MKGHALALRLGQESLALYGIGYLINERLVFLFGNILRSGTKFFHRFQLSVYVFFCHFVSLLVAHFFSLGGLGIRQNGSVG